MTGLEDLAAKLAAIEDRMARLEGGTPPNIPDGHVVEFTPSRRPKFFYSSGALMCNQEIPGLTQDLGEPATQGTLTSHYNGRWFVCEGLDVLAAATIAGC